MSWEGFERDWREALKSNSSSLSCEERDFLIGIQQEIEDILIHMPAKGVFSKSLDWNKWMQDDDFLRFTLSKEAIQYPLTADIFRRIISSVVKSGVIRRPYKNDDSFRSEVNRYIAASLA
ncbi:MAG: hypothetical protein KF802_04050 [Bdellovibrionaceae bacterium]|nr:hypothetical protein [Pseudobdellovibrionaceae bacterium]